MSSADKPIGKDKPWSSFQRSHNPGPSWRPSSCRSRAKDLELWRPSAALLVEERSWLSQEALGGRLERSQTLGKMTCAPQNGTPRSSINHLDLAQPSLCCMSMTALESITIFIHLSFLPSSNQFHLSNIYWLSAINKHCVRNVRYMWWTHTVVPALTEREK